MKYTDLTGKCFDFNGIIYYRKDSFEKGSPISGGCYSNCNIISHITKDGEDYAEFTTGYYVKVDDIFAKFPNHPSIILSNQINYEIY